MFEVDITRSSIDKLGLYAQFGVVEIWRHDGGAATILVLGDGGYRQTDRSQAVPGMDAETLTQLLADGRGTPLPRWLAAVRAWARATVPPR